MSDQASADSVARRVCFEYHPYKPEMILQLCGAQLRQYDITTVSGGFKTMAAPYPGMETPAVALGKPGSGKTTVVKACMRNACAQGGRVLFALPTAQFATRMREAFRDDSEVEVATCHAAFKLDQPLPLTAAHDALRPGRGGRGIPARVEFERILKRARPSGCARWSYLGTCTSSPASARRALGRAPRGAAPIAITSSSSTCGASARGVKRKQATPRLPISRLSMPSADRHLLHAPWCGGRECPAFSMVARRRWPPCQWTWSRTQTTTSRGSCARADPRAHLMQLYLTKNVCKEDDYINGMLCTVEAYLPAQDMLRVRAQTGHRLAITCWTDADKQGAVDLGMPAPSTMQGDDSAHITVYLDLPGMPAAGYMALSRVATSDCYLHAGRPCHARALPAGHVGLWRPRRRSKMGGSSS